MSGILELKRWERVTYDAGGGASISMELKRLKRHEAKALRNVLIAAAEEAEKAKDDNLTTAQKAAIVAKVFDVVPEEELQRIFGGCVRRIQGLVIDGEEVSTGSGLLEEADDSVLLFVLFNLRALSTLSNVEGKASSSPSISSSTVPPAATSSGAPSIESDGGIGPSTAQETSGQLVPFTRSAEA